MADTITADTITRRRFIGISAAAAGLSLQPLRAATQVAPVTWRGVALGAAASLQIYHQDRAFAEKLIQRSLDELQRLERLFSLYRDDSVLVTLNRRGVLEAPPAELVELLGEARRYFELTGGMFDPTVQPLWTLYTDHFSKAGASSDGPPADEVKAALAKVGLDGVLVSRDRIALARRGMALTLNGIAQGCIADRIVAVLRAGGIAHSLVDMGESRALGGRPDGQPWQVGLTDPDHPERIAASIPLVDQAVATSGGYGFRFDAQGRFNHLFDPRTGRSADRHASVTALMPTATAADALSTAFTLLPADAVSAALQRLGEGQAHITTAGGQRITLSA
jgi:thiamine biosynthesis lipoprotein